MVWALPRSLAATEGIDVSFSSSGYLDVSVPRVSLHKLFIHLYMTVHYYSRISPFGYLRVIGYLLLTAAFRSLSRPSSAPSAKASALCSFMLDLACRLLSMTVFFSFTLLIHFSKKVFFFLVSRLHRSIVLPSFMIPQI